MKKQKGNVLVGLLGLAAVAAIVIGAIVGYIWNIVKLFSATDAGIGEIAIRIIGVFTGIIGAVAGYF